MFAAWMKTVTVPEGHIALLYRRGRYERTVEPGEHWLGWARKSVLVDLRETWVNVMNQEVMTRDQVGIKLSTAVRYRVVDATRALHSVRSYQDSLHLETQLAVRALVAELEVEDALSARKALDAKLLETVKPKAAELGLDVREAAFKDFMLAGDLKKTFAEVVRQRKEGLAALERARGEAAALRVLANAARLMEAHPSLLNLRLVQSLGPSSTVVLGAQGFAPLNRSETKETES